jgi:hypothetical protein
MRSTLNLKTVPYDRNVVTLEMLLTSEAALPVTQSKTSITLIGDQQKMHTPLWKQTLNIAYFPAYGAVSAIIS